MTGKERERSVFYFLISFFHFPVPMYLSSAHDTTGTIDALDRKLDLP